MSSRSRSSGKSGGKSAQTVKRKAKSRSGSSYTKTATKKRRVSEAVIHNDLSVIKLGSVRVGVQVRPKVQGTYRYRNVQQWVITGLQGQQVSDYPEVILPRQVLVGQTDNSRFARLNIADDLFELNPYVTAPSSTIYPGPVPDIPGNDNMNVRGVATTLEFLSMAVVPQVVKVYWLTPKFDTDVNPIDFWNQLVLKKNMTQSTAGFATALANININAGGASISNPNANPFTHAEFRKAWHCLKKIDFVLQAGDQRNYRIAFEINSVVNRITLTDCRKDTFMRGITVFPLVIVKAGLEKIEHVSGDTGEVAYGQCKLGIIHNQEITMGALNVARLSTNRIHKGVIEQTSETEKLINVVDTIMTAAEL